MPNVIRYGGKRGMTARRNINNSGEKLIDMAFSRFNIASRVREQRLTGLRRYFPALILSVSLSAGPLTKWPGPLL